MLCRMRRRVVPVVCALAQALSPGAGLPPATSGAAVAAASAAGVASGLLLGWRQRAPVAVLAGAGGGYLLQALLRGAVVPVVVLVAVVGVARHAAGGGPQHRRAAVAAVTAAVGVPGVVALTGAVDQAPAYAVLVLLAVLAGVLLGVRSGRRAQAERDLVSAERLRLARDLHDAVGHGLSAITLQAGAGRLALAAGDADTATRALGHVEEAGRAVLRDVRWLVTVLREDEVAGRPGLDDVRRLVEDAARTGLPVRLDWPEGEARQVSVPVGEVAFRVVQEALTNALRHAGGAPVTVRVRSGAELVVDVADEQPGPVPAVPPGHGLRGMRERVTAVGGTLEAGPGDGRGWRVRAVLPAGGA